MDKLELVQKIGEEMCGDCGPDRDCGLEIDDCNRIANALEMLEMYEMSLSLEVERNDK